LKKAFTNPWAVYSVIQNNSISIFGQCNSLLRLSAALWQKNVVNIACHLDSGKPLYRVIFRGREDGGVSCQSIILDIENIKIAPSSMYEMETPVICVKFARTDGSESFEDMITNSSSNLPGKGSDGIVILHCTEEEIESGLLMLEQNSTFIDKGYLKEWSNGANKNGIFRPSFLRPANKPKFSHKDLVNLQSEEKMVDRMNSKGIVRDEIYRAMKVVKAMRREATYKRRVERRQGNVLEIGSSIIPTSLTNTCAVSDCECVGIYQCSTCKSVFYCGAGHQRNHWPIHKDKCKELTASYKIRVANLEAIDNSAGKEATKVIKAASATPVPAPVATPVLAPVVITSVPIRECRRERIIMPPAVGPLLEDTVTKDLPVTRNSPSPYAPGMYMHGYVTDQ
jgi:hypothetical protein